MERPESERRLLAYVTWKRELRQALQERPLSVWTVPRGLPLAARCWLRMARRDGWASGLRLARWAVRDLLVRHTRLLFPLRAPYARFRLAVGRQPLSQVWGLDRGVPVHRYYLQRFLDEFAADVRGHCLEFQEDSYTSRVGAGRVTRREILHKEPGNAEATLVADLTGPNELPGDRFDCIVCTYVLNVIVALDRAVAELYRILKPGGALLVAVPQSAMRAEHWQDVWRFTPDGLRVVLARAFGDEHVTVRAYGNSLTAAGDLRALVADEFTRAELEYHDPRFAVVVCARAVKRPRPGSGP